MYLFISTGTHQIPLVLVGNKSDLKSYRQVPLELILTRKQLEMANCPYVETSAKYNCNVGHLFLQLLQQAKQHQQTNHCAPNGRKIGRGRTFMRRLSSSFGSLPNLSLLRRRSAQPLDKLHTGLSTVNTLKHEKTVRRPPPAELQLTSLTSNAGTQQPESNSNNNNSNNNTSNNNSNNNNIINSNINNNRLDSPNSLSSNSCNSSVDSVCNSSMSDFSTTESVCDSVLGSSHKLPSRKKMLRASSDETDSRLQQRFGFYSPVFGRKILRTLVKPQLSLDEAWIRSSTFKEETFDSGTSSLSSVSSTSLMNISMTDQRCSLM